MRCNHLPGDYNGGPSLTEWLSQIWKAVKSIVENGVKNPHKLTFTGDVEAEYDGSKDVTVDISGGGGGGGGGGGDKPIVYKISSAAVTGSNIASQIVGAQVVQIGKQLIIRGYLLAFAESTVAAVTGIDLKFSSSVPSLPSVSSSLRFINAGFYVSETKISNTFELTIDKFGNEYLLTFRQGSNSLNVTTNADGERGFFYMVVFLE